MKAHPAAEQFDLLVGDDFRSLVTDIKTRGLRFPITTFNGMILDGRNRYRACKLAGVEPRTKEFEGTEEDALNFVISANVERRHLTESQRALVAVKMLPLFEAQARERMLRGKKDPSAPVHQGTGKAVEQVAAKLKVSPRIVQQAKKVMAEAPKEVVEQIRRGGMTVGAAYQALRQAKVATKVDAKITRRIEKEVDEHPRAVAAYMDALKVLGKLEVREHAAEAAKQKKFSPEAQRFVRRLHDIIRTTFTQVEEHFNG